MINQFVKPFYEELNNLKQTQVNHKQCYSTIIRHCTTTLQALRKYIIAHQFESVNDEVYFFKEVKCLVMSELIYYEEILEIELKLSITNSKVKKANLVKHQRKLTRFFAKNESLVNYLGLGYTHLDQFFYTRQKVAEQSFLGHRSYNTDPSFYTPHDFIISKITAYKRVEKYIQKHLEALKNPDLLLELYNQDMKLNWTGSKTALTELIYGLYYSNVINGGKTELKQLATVLSKVFNVDLGDIYKIYSEIKLRQKSKTKFLEEMVYSLQDEINKSSR